ncbi:MAG: ribonuclease HII [Oscillospiraceae bacterium]|nr:ribonuclease HII [Oscillospiraceae bacterium]
MITFEPQEFLYNQLGFIRVCGVDEAGRGPLAGDVYAAAVILPVGASIASLNDSKKLTPKKRDLLFDEIQRTAICFAIASATAEEIDRINILQAALLAMRRAVDALQPAADFALIDGNQKPRLAIPCETLVKGDARCASIAAASILAKVARDRAMDELDARYPGYGFAKHKGYPTVEHYASIARLGVSPVHRKSFTLFRP